MKLEEVQALWAEDSKINYKDIPLMDRDTLNGGQLHSKYSNILGLHKTKAKQLESTHVTLQYRLEQYYINNLFCEELGKTDKDGKNVPRRPIPKLARTKDEASKMVAADPKMYNLTMQIAENDEICLLAKSIVEYIRWNRTKDIANHIDWLKWNNGE